MRSRTGLFVVEGPQAVREALAHRPDHVRDIYVTSRAAARHCDLMSLATGAEARVHEVTEEVLAALCDTESPQGIVAVCRMLAVDLDGALDGLPPDAVVCVLTNVRDPGNAGTVIRGADAAGADLVLVSEASVDIHNPKVVRSSAGSLFHLPIVAGLPIEQILSSLRARGVALLATDGSGTTLLPDVDLARPHAWVMGNEAWGLPATVRDACDVVVRVPIHGLAESLNLAMAATLCLYESARIRHG